MLILVLLTAVAEAKHVHTFLCINMHYFGKTLLIDNLSVTLFLF